MALSGPDEVMGRIPEPEEVARARWRRIGKAFRALVVVLGLQAFYISKVVAPKAPPDLTGVDTILVFGGASQRIQTGIMLAERLGPKWVVYSGTAGEKLPARGKAKPWVLVPVSGAYTTDQNARMTVPELKKLGAKSVLLVTSWYHMPRALFATRVYLLGSGIRVTHIAAEAPPREWWKDRRLLGEVPRFWGTVMRMGLAVVGVENWPRPGGSGGRS